MFMASLVKSCLRMKKEEPEARELATISTKTMQKKLVSRFFFSVKRCKEEISTNKLPRGAIKASFKEIVGLAAESSQKVKKSLTYGKYKLLTGQYEKKEVVWTVDRYKPYLLD